MAPNPKLIINKIHLDKDNRNNMNEPQMIQGLTVSSLLELFSSHY